MVDGTPYSRTRWRQEDISPNAEPQQVDLTITQPVASEIYYSACGMIDRYNQCCQDDLNIEKKLVTREWAKRLNLSVFAMCVVDLWLE